MEDMQTILIEKLKLQLQNKEMTLEEMDKSIQEITKCSSNIFDSTEECIKDGFCICEVQVGMDILVYFKVICKNNNNHKTLIKVENVTKG